MNIPQILKKTDKQFIEWASEQLVEKPEHELKLLPRADRDLWICKKCSESRCVRKDFTKFCDRPLLKLDFNTAKMWQGKCEMNAYLEAMMAVYDADTRSWCFNEWLLFYAHPRHCFIAVVKCLGDK